MTYQYQQYPKTLYHRRLAPNGKVFENADEADAALVGGWVDTPAKFPKPSELSLAELRDDFLAADEAYRHWTSNGASEPGSQIWEEATAARNAAKDRYDFRLREAELSEATSKTPKGGNGKVEIFHTAFGAYRVHGVLGEGANGTVYDVRDEDGKPKAIKCLKPTALIGQKLKRFKNEIAFCSKVKHSNLVSVEDWGLVQVGQSQLPFFVMPRYPSTLRNLMTTGILPSDALSWFLQVLAGVEEAHVNGVWHRDLKPENLLCDQSTGRLVVSDFGIAHLAESFLQTTIQTQPRDRMANFQYASPEQRRSGTVDSRADIYALGLILNELFTGEVPQGTGHKLIGTVTPEFAYLDALVERMIRQSANDRPASVAEIREELSAHETLLRKKAAAAGGAQPGPDTSSAPTTAGTGSTEVSGDVLFDALKLSIFESADRTFPQPAFIDALQLGHQFGVAVGYVHEFMTELHRDGYISIAKWDGTRERSFELWTSAEEFFYHPIDGNSIRVRMKRLGKQTLQNLLSRSR